MEQDNNASRGRPRKSFRETVQANGLYPSQNSFIAEMAAARDISKFAVLRHIVSWYIQSSQIQLDSKE